MFGSFGANDTERVVQEYKNTIARIAFQYTKNWMDAEDVTQDVIIRWLQKKPYFSTKGHEKAWFIRVTINICKDRLRSMHNKANLLFDEAISTSYLSDTTTNVTNIEMLNVIFSLPEKYRIVVYLHYYERYTLNEIAAIYKKSPNTIQTWHERAKKMLRKMIGDEDHELGNISSNS